MVIISEWSSRTWPFYMQPCYCTYGHWWVGGAEELEGAGQVGKQAGRWVAGSGGGVVAF